jgi:hypothetical protein
MGINGDPRSGFTYKTTEHNTVQSTERQIIINNLTANLWEC